MEKGSAEGNEEGDERRFILHPSAFILELLFRANPDDDTLIAFSRKTG